MSKQNQKLKSLILSSVAIIFQWFDFLIFGFYAVYISKLFFPFQNETTSIITTFIVFGVSFLFRPLGAVVISNIGDRYGRKNAFMLTVILMTFPTFFIGLLPTYSQIGITATILIILLRILQGFALGGERSSTLSILIEMAPKNLRGFYTVFAGFSTTAGIILASAVCGFISSQFTFNEMLDFGWRIPFLSGIVTGIFWYLLKNNLSESEKFNKLKSSNKTSDKPISDALRYNRKEIIVTLLATLVFAVGFYAIFVYLITFASTVGNMKLSDMLNMNTINLSIMTLCIPLFGYLSDKIGRKPLLVFGSAGMLFSSLVIFNIFVTGSYISKFLIQTAFGIFISVYAAGLYPYIVELLPTRIRMTGISLGHVVSFSIFGGSVPFIISTLVKNYGYELSPGIYVAFFSVVSLVSVLFTKETYKKELE